MKLSSLIVALTAGSAGATPVPEPEAVDHAAVVRRQFEKRQGFGVGGLDPALAGLVPMIAGLGVLPMVVKGLNSGYGKVADVPGAAPRRVDVPARSGLPPNAKTVKIRYGPFKVPTATRRNLVGGYGTLFNWPELNVERPCTGDCVLLTMAADLEYPDGTNANTNNGMWLHHMVLNVEGPGRFDPTCKGKTSLPHMLLSSSPDKSERLMASGNERSRARFDSPYQPAEKLGYYLNKDDKFSLIVDFMNEKAEDRTVYLTMTFDYLDGRPAGYSNFRTIWLDVAQCGTSELPAPVQSGKFSVSEMWTANLNGDILGAGGHLHDGGTELTLEVNEKVICRSVASYSNGTGGGMGGMAGGAMGGMNHGRTVESLNELTRLVDLNKRDPPSISGVAHISAMSPCFGTAIGLQKIEKGQKWKITGHYDYDKHAGMKNSAGKQTNVMGIALVLVKNWSA